MKKIFLKLFIVFVLFVPIDTCVADNANNASGNASTKFPNPLSGVTSGASGEAAIPLIIGQVIKSVLGIVGSLALAMFVYGGLIWMTAAGAPDKITKGKDVLVWASIGLLVIFSSYALVAFVIQGVTVTKP
ncbi:hypothetical protein ISS03_02615 [Patescibacteria group bacterium]|nr:hypothetical protein [Patescibacteria group bacterium]